MAYVLRTDEGKKIVIDLDTDTQLYSAQLNSSHTRGVDIYAHNAQSGNIYFYKHCWTQWQKESDHILLISREETEEILIEMAGFCDERGLTDEEIKQAKEFGFDLMEETA